LIELRAQLGETQQAFAHRVGAAVTSVARWETTYPPRGRTLDRLARIAEENGRKDLALRLRSALRRVSTKDLIHFFDIAIPTLGDLPKFKGNDFKTRYEDLLKGMEQARDMAIALDKQGMATEPQPKGAKKKGK
jgi:transcriptional regulator with XRE-family HTH domain